MAIEPSWTTLDALGITHGLIFNGKHLVFPSLPATEMCQVFTAPSGSWWNSQGNCSRSQASLQDRSNHGILVKGTRSLQSILREFICFGREIWITAFFGNLGLFMSFLLMVWHAKRVWVRGWCMQNLLLLHQESVSGQNGSLAAAFVMGELRRSSKICQELVKRMYWGGPSVWNLWCSTATSLRVGSSGQAERCNQHQSTIGALDAKLGKEIKSMVS